MSGVGAFTVVLYFALLTAAAYPLGLFVARAWSGERSVLSPVLAPIERLLCRAGGVSTEMPWTGSVMRRRSSSSSCSAR